MLKFSPGWLEKLSDDELSDLEAELQDLEDAKCEQDPLYWVQNCTLTENPKYLEQHLPFKAPFPRKSYFKPLFKNFQTQRRLFIPKSRELMTSWCAIAYATNQAQWKKAEVIVQTDKEDKAIELVGGYATCLYRNQPDWLKQRHPLKQDPTQLSIEWKGGGRVIGLPKGVNQVRMYHPTIVMFDEAAFLPEFQQCYDTTNPVAGQIIAVSSAGPSFFGDECTR